MFGLCTGYYHMYFNKPEYYVIILGLDCAGKTTLLERIKAIFSNKAPLPPQSIRPTVGLNSKIFTIAININIVIKCFLIYFNFYSRES